MCFIFGKVEQLHLQWFGEEVSTSASRGSKADRERKNPYNKNVYYGTKNEKNAVADIGGDSPVRTNTDTSFGTNANISSTTNSNSKSSSNEPEAEAREVLPSKKIIV